MKKETAIVIPAREGSTRFPRKPLHPILGKPMISWVVEACLDIKEASIIVATDSHKIAEIAEKKGAKAIIVKGNIKSGTERVYRAVDGMGFSYIINLQGDEPAVTSSHIIPIINFLRNNSHPQVVTMKYPCNKEDAKDPNVVKVICDSQKRAIYFSRSPIPYNRSGTVKYFKHIGIYGFTHSALSRFVNLAPTYLEKSESLEQLRLIENGIPIKVLDAPSDTVGVDVPEDIEKVEKILLKRLDG